MEDSSIHAKNWFYWSARTPCSQIPLPRLRREVSCSKGLPRVQDDGTADREQNLVNPSGDEARNRDRIGCDKYRMGQCSASKQDTRTQANSRMRLHACPGSRCYLAQHQTKRAILQRLDRTYNRRRWSPPEPTRLEFLSKRGAIIHLLNLRVRGNGEFPPLGSTSGRVLRNGDEGVFCPFLDSARFGN